MDAEQPQWALAAILGRVNQYYFTGTMQDGVLLIPRGGEPVLWVRRSFERACAESLLPDIRPMSSFRDAAQSLGKIPETIHFEADVVPFGLVQRFRKHFPCREVAALDAQVAKVRAVKSALRAGADGAGGGDSPAHHGGGGAQAVARGDQRSGIWRRPVSRHGAPGPPGAGAVWRLRSRNAGRPDWVWRELALPDEHGQSRRLPGPGARGSRVGQCRPQAAPRGPGVSGHRLQRRRLSYRQDPHLCLRRRPFG